MRVCDCVYECASEFVFLFFTLIYFISQHSVCKVQGFQRQGLKARVERLLGAIKFVGVLLLSYPVDINWLKRTSVCN